MVMDPFCVQALNFVRGQEMGHAINWKLIEAYLRDKFGRYFLVGCWFGS